GGPHTAFPAAINLGASWNPALVREVAAAIADEAKDAGKNMVLGPCVNIARHPFGGRNFESFGEDPLLNASLGEEYVRGVQGQGVLASVKHFAVNDQEIERDTIDTIVSRRALFELHLPAFQAAVDAGCGSVMSSYNKVNGHWASENHELLTNILKKRWGFRGFVVSDWESLHDTVRAANAGMDLEMPYGRFFGPKLETAIAEGKVSSSLLNDKVRRILSSALSVGILDAPEPKAGPITEHRDLARRAAAESLVLLKNEGATLPLDKPKILAVVGPNALSMPTGGGGSSKVVALRDSEPLKALTEALPFTRILFEPGAPLAGEFPELEPRFFKPSLGAASSGLRAEYFDNAELAGPASRTSIEASPRYTPTKQELRENFSVRWSGFVHLEAAGTYRFSTLSDDGLRLFIDGKPVIDHWAGHSAAGDEAEVKVKNPGWKSFRLEYAQGSGGAVLRLGWEMPGEPLLKAAVKAALAAAREKEPVLVFAGLGQDAESEGRDLPAYRFPSRQLSLIRAVAAVNPRTVVVLNSGNPLPLEGWIRQVPAVVMAWYPGQEGGFALADMLTGRMNPSGKLPVSFLKRWEDSSVLGNYPGKDGKVTYEEGVFVGYRHLDAKKIAPTFPFGHGLSYTHFSLADLRIKVDQASRDQPFVSLSFRIKNEGNRAGAEVPQVYVGEASPSLPRPPRELRAFTRVQLDPGQETTVTLALDAKAFAYFNETSDDWRINPGSFEIAVGTSSRNLLLSDTIVLR
ncbi:MAG: beta-glucosidase, partial [Proteobacteria bacterium]